MSTLEPATTLAAKASKPYPNDSDEYRRARVALLAEEIELRRHIMRRPMTAMRAISGAWRRTAASGRRSISGSGARARSTTSGARNWVARKTRDKTRAARPIRRPCGICWT